MLITISGPSRPAVGSCGSMSGPALVVTDGARLCVAEAGGRTAVAGGHTEVAGRHTTVAGGRTTVASGRTAAAGGCTAAARGCPTAWSPGPTIAGRRLATWGGFAA